jgi:quercetin dioxygenase-like cupin family protein
LCNNIEAEEPIFVIPLDSKLLKRSRFHYCQIEAINQLTFLLEQIMNNKPEVEKSKPHLMTRLIDYMLKSVVIKTIIKKLTGNISVLAFDKGEGMSEKTSPYDSFAQVIEGKAEIVIDKVPNVVESGEGIIIPAETANSIKPNGRFKMILTNLKSGKGENPIKQ